MSKEIAPSPADTRASAAQASALEHVITRVREDVRQGLYAPGARVVEAELQRTLGVSRGTVREALSRLAAEGLLDLNRFRGATVRALSRQDVREILEMREVLEGLVARKAAMRIAAGHDRKEIATAQAALDASLEPGTSNEAYLQANTRYHETLLAVAGSARLAAQINQLSTAFVRTTTRDRLSRASFQSSNDDHRAITTAILEGDAAAAEILMRAHIRRTTLILESLYATPTDETIDIKS